MDLNKINKLIENEPNYRRLQIKQAIFKLLIDDWNQATNLPQDLRLKLVENCPLEISAEIFKTRQAVKAIIRLDDGEKIESVMLTNADGRHTVCVSSQVGCPLGCAFCATGKLGFKRNLTAEEIVNQVVLFARELKQKEQRVDNVVFMGMGEPLLNWPEVSRALLMLNDADGLNISARGLSVSTCGLSEGIEKLSEFPLQVNLAISLHASDNELRSALMPINNAVSLDDLFASLKKYLAIKNRKIMFEYLLLRDVNDSRDQARQLAKLLKKLPAKLVMVNLIAYNPTGDFLASESNHVRDFKKELEGRGVNVTVRESLGGDIFGACGQLANRRSV